MTDALFPDGENTGLDAVTRRIKNSVAKLGGAALAAGSLDDIVTANRDGVRNTAAIFLASDATFTAGTANDLLSMARLSESERGGTALSAIFADEKLRDGPAQRASMLLQIRDMTDRQYNVANDLLSKPFSVVQGPPGTGKSDVIVAVIASLVASGMTVLFASKNHQALDEVEKRLNGICDEIPFLVRGRDADGERDTNFIAELKALAATEPRHPHSKPPPEIAFEFALKLTSQKAEHLKRSELELKLADLIDRLERSGQNESIQSEDTVSRSSLLAIILRAIARFWHKPTRMKPSAEFAPSKATTSEIRQQCDAIRRQIEAMQKIPSADKMQQLDDSYRQKLFAALRQIFEWITKLDDDSRDLLVSNIQDLEFNGVTKSKRLEFEDAKLLLRHRPVWAISTLSVPSRIPLCPGLFDIAIVDEASQCDVASALPIFFRAKRAAIVGDPLQLSFIPPLSKEHDNALMDAAGLPLVGRSRIAHSVNSLFAFANARPGRARHFLADQFRSASGIINYLNDEFYRGRLVGRLADDGFKAVPGFNPGITWVDVTGTIGGGENRNQNEAEAAEVAQQVAKLALNIGFTGTIGILSPFNGQIFLIQDKVDALLHRDVQKRVKLKIASIDKFQGGEADVIFFSMVYTEAAPSGVTNFLQRDARRFNVAVSRARAVCIIVGDLSAARKSKIRHLERLAHHATGEAFRKRDGFDSIWEERLFNALKQRGLDPKSQHQVGSRSLDIALFHENVKLDVEVDGRLWHQDRDGNRKVADLIRDREMQGRGWKVRRFWVSEIDRDMEKCLELIESDLRNH